MEKGGAIYLKLESANPGGSVKDRIALAMIEDAEQSGALEAPEQGASSRPPAATPAWGHGLRGRRQGLPHHPGDARDHDPGAPGHPEGLRRHPRADPGPLGMKGAVDKAEELAAADPKFWVVRQFDNPANPEVHRRTTALEILEQVPSWTPSWPHRHRRHHHRRGRSAGQEEARHPRGGGEPVDSPLLTQGKAGPHKLQGLGANFVPRILNREAFQRVEDVGYDDAIAIARRLTREEGIFTGISTGAIVFTALKIARELGAGKTVVAVVCDTGERYLSHPLFSEA